MKTPITERRRSKLAALRWGVSTFALAAAAGWAISFDVFNIPKMGGPFLEPSQNALIALGRALAEIWEINTGLKLADYQPVLSILAKQAMTLSFFGRVGTVLGAATVAAFPIMRWRFQQTPRRRKAKWVGVDIPRWSEGPDAIAHANATLADGIARTGRGLEIVPAVTLSQEQTARSILTVADPGGGKTVCFWHQIFQLLETNCFLIVHDTKGDMTARWPNADFILLAPQDTRSWGWAIGKDIVGKILAREFAASLVVASDREPNWPSGAQEILVGVILTLQVEKKTGWGWADLKQALSLDDAPLKEFACRYHAPAMRFLALDENQNLTKNAQSYLSTLMAPINRLIEPLAAAWNDIDPTFQLSLREWLDNPNPARRTLILQRAPDLPAMSTAWIGSAVQVIVRHLVSTRRDRNPGDAKKATLPDCWILADEFTKLGPMPAFFELMEVGRSLGLRCMIGLQNFQQVARVYNDPHAPTELVQLVGNLICFHLNPGPDSKRICEERLTTAPMRTWTKKDDNNQTKGPDSEEVRILLQDDLARLKITRDGAEGYLIIDNAAFGLLWPFPETPIQREASIRGAWIKA
jgi:Type IV secretion-system coupling protein DNA-binding domain